MLWKTQVHKPELLSSVVALPVSWQGVTVNICMHIM